MAGENHATQRSVGANTELLGPAAACRPLAQPSTRARCILSIRVRVRAYGSPVVNTHACNARRARGTGGGFPQGCAGEAASSRVATLLLVPAPTSSHEGLTSGGHPRQTPNKWRSASHGCAVMTSPWRALGAPPPPSATHTVAPQQSVHQSDPTRRRLVALHCKHSTRASTPLLRCRASCSPKLVPPFRPRDEGWFDPYLLTTALSKRSAQLGCQPPPTASLLL